MRMSYSPAAHLFLFLVQWTDCSLAGALGLLRVLIYKVDICFLVNTVFKAIYSYSFDCNSRNSTLRFMSMAQPPCQSMKEKQVLKNSMVRFD